MEAAALLPVLMLLVALLVQPICLLYTTAIMREAAGEAARVLATRHDVQEARLLALRRLQAVPEAGPFHTGGSSDWLVSCAVGRDGRRTTVQVSGHARPLPLFGVLFALLGTSDAVGIRLCVQTSAHSRPQWLEGSYEQWIAVP